MIKKEKFAIILVISLVASFIVGLIVGMNIDKFDFTVKPMVLVDSTSFVVANEIAKGQHKELHNIEKKGLKQEFKITEKEKELFNKLIKSQIEQGKFRPCTGRPICTYIKPHTYKLGTGIGF